MIICQKSIRSIDDIFQFLHKNMPDLRMKIMKLDILKMTDSDPANPDVGNGDD